MGKLSRLASAERHLVRRLDEADKKVFTEAQLSRLIDENRVRWGLPITTPSAKLLSKFLERGVFKLVILQVGDNQVPRYFYREPGIYEIAISLRAKSYISHFPALLLNGLSNQIPKTIYTTHELSEKPKRPSTISQENIDSAFAKPQRRSGLECLYEDYKIVLLEGKSTGRAGVINVNGITYTNLERTLLDSTVRPNYAGGASSVLEAYRVAISNNLSVNKLVALLSKMEFIYPYHQAVGFYLERAGYSGSLLGVLKRKPMIFDFYLDYDLPDKEYSSNWKIYYPKGM